MGRTAYAEERLYDYLTSVANLGKYTIGLILGQSTGQKDYIVHLTKTPPPQKKNVVEETLISPATNVQHDTADNYIKCVEDIKETWVADHAKHVTKMLPGGMWILGIFIVGPEDIINNNNNIQKLRSIFITLDKHLSHNKYLHGNNKEEKLILILNSITQTYTCKSIDIHGKEAPKPVELKLQNKSLKWHQLEVLVDFDKLFFIPANKDPKTLRKQLLEILNAISDMIDSTIIVIEDKIWTENEAIETISNMKENTSPKTKEKKSNKKALQIDLYIPCKRKYSNSDISITPCSASIRLVGQLVSRTFVHQKACIEEAILAVKQDIIRSLASRLEMHWDSLIEEENGSPEENITLHEPPRRVLIALPESKVTLSDYLFPGEGPQEALLSLQELLDLEVQESNVQKDIEIQADPTEFYCQSEIDVKPVDHTKDTAESNQTTLYLTGFSIAFIILIAAIIIYQLY